jgi:hypothetical protein
MFKMFKLIVLTLATAVFAIPTDTEPTTNLPKDFNPKEAKIVAQFAQAANCEPVKCHCGGRICYLEEWNGCVYGVCGDHPWY